MPYFFKQSSQTKEVQIKEGGFGIGLWYENSIINNRCCYSLFGDTIYVAEKGFGFSNNVGTLYTSELLSYEEAIYSHRDNKGFFVGKRSFKLGRIYGISKYHSLTMNLLMPRLRSV